MIHAIGVLIRARLLIARNTFWRGKISRKIGVLALLALVAFGAYGLYWFMSATVRFLTSQPFFRTLELAAKQDPSLGLPALVTRADIQPYLDALPNAKLAPTTDPAWDRVKLDVQQNIGLAVQPGGNPKQVLDRLQKNAVAAAGGR